jgi:hypothetical protein
MLNAANPCSSGSGCGVSAVRMGEYVPASSTSARSSSSVAVTSRRSRKLRMAPLAPTLIQSAPARTMRRTAALAASGPSNTGVGQRGVGKPVPGSEVWCPGVAETFGW